MDHRPFEDWLDHSLELSPREKRLLEAHLQECPSCRSQSTVARALSSAPLLAPPPGFPERFQLRLSARKQAQRRRNSWGFLLLSLSVAGFLVRLAWPLLRAAWESPVNLLGSWASGVITVWATLLAMLRAGAVVVSVVPPFVWIAVLAAAACWSLLWVFSLVKFTKLPQGVDSL